MKVTITESQFNRMINNSNRWGLIGISEAMRGPALTPERIKRKSDYYELKYLGTIDGRTPNEEYKKTLYNEFGYTEVVDSFKETNKDGAYNSDYRWLNEYNKDLFRKLSVRQKSVDKQQRSLNKKPKSNYYELKYLGTIDGIVPNEDEKKKFYVDYVETLDDREKEKFYTDYEENKNNQPVTFSGTDYNWLYYNNKPLFNKISSVYSTHITEKDVREKAKDFKFREHFRLAFKSHHNYAERNGILDDLFPFEKEERGKLKQKDIDEAIEVSKKYSSKGEFQIFDAKYYRRLDRAQKNIPEYSGILNILFPNKKNESLGEKYIKEILNEMEIKFEHDKGDGECKGEEIQKKAKNGKSYPFCPIYRFDFIIPKTIENIEIINKLVISGDTNKAKENIKNSNINGIMIEFDGEYHFFDKKPNRRENESFENDIARDIIKNKYCSTKGIKLIRIPYTSVYKGRDKIKDEIINGFNSPEPIVLTGNYPKLGWNKQ